MIEIKNLLLNFRNLLLSGEVKKGLILEVIKKITGVLIKKEEIEVKNGILYLNTKPIHKNEIFMKQDQVLAELKESFGKKSPTEIR